ncbi:MAG: hypothetical protein IJX71_01980 [Oscillospiraceae bacterium]|nr:hypothetical protein [Oscillospiraceae bacterium]
MYNRYIPEENYQPVESGQAQTERQYSNQRPGNRQAGGPFSFLSGLLGGTKNAGGAGILERLGLQNLDSGDILLLLILFYLFRETEDEEWLIILALMFVMGLG